MPVAKSLRNVQKKIEGQEKSLHPRGRKFQQLNKATLRHAKLQKQQAKRANAKSAERKLTRDTVQARSNILQLWGISTSRKHANSQTPRNLQKTRSETWSRCKFVHAKFWRV